MGQAQQRITVTQTGGFAGVIRKNTVLSDDPRISRQWEALKRATNFDTIIINGVRDVEPGFAGRYDDFNYSIAAGGRTITAEGGDRTPLATIIIVFVTRVLSFRRPYNPHS